ncbi:IPTL-CTERM sorting domain-containing protein [Zoogloea sp.]|uniref:IPTL-CTERM sorting domain-containing protein n=1 Tax=Zoogloea sp. TaxID=49181 RepID=UPI0014165248|nr:MAG: IPTL-CTERM sorting domain-containing protein [Zoogloea sp.]
MTRALFLLLSLYSALSFAATSEIVAGPSSTDTTYAPTISAGENTNIATYSSSFKWIYTLHSFQVCESGVYTATSTTTSVVNTTFFLNGTFTPSPTFPPTTPISNFIVSDFSGGSTSSFTGINLTAGQPYSVLVAYNQTTPGTYAYTDTLTMNGPGNVIFNGNGSCAATPVPTLSGWAQILMALALVGIAGWQYRRYTA